MKRCTWFVTLVFVFASFSIGCGPKEKAATPGAPTAGAKEKKKAGKAPAAKPAKKGSKKPK